MQITIYNSFKILPWVLAITPKILEIPVEIQMERSVLVSSDRNIRDHLWKWSTYFGQNIPTEIHRFIVDKPVLCPNQGKQFKMTRAISIGWPGFIGKCCSIFLRYSHLSLAGQFLICFWLVKTTHIIHCNQLLLTKFGKDIVEPMTSKVLSYWTNDVKMMPKEQPLQVIELSIKKTWGGCVIFSGQKNKERNDETPLRTRKFFNE